MNQSLLNRSRVWKSAVLWAIVWMGFAVAGSAGFLGGASIAWATASSASHDKRAKDSVGVVTHTSTDDTSGGEDSAVVIQKRKGNLLNERDFEIISGTTEVIGDPEMGQKASYSSWKAACAEWKKELRETNHENQIISMSCGSPTKQSESSGQLQYRSDANYKIRVRIRGAGGK